MIKKHFKAFADYIADLRQTAVAHSNMENECGEALAQAEVCEDMVVEVFKMFFKNFDEKKFRKACQPKG